MTDRPGYVLSTYIRCTQDALWEALTDAGAAAHYHPFTPDAVREGDAIVYKLPDGSDMLLCRETALTPKSRIEATFEPRWAPGIPRLPHRLDDRARGTVLCRLTLEHYDIPDGGEGYAEGWERLVAGLKTWLETGETARVARPEAAE